MRVLVVTNVYPPYHLGGYELACKTAVEDLLRRGHDVEVLTGTYGVDGPRSEDGVHRLLQTTIGWGRKPRPVLLARVASMEANNPRVLARVAARFRPDVVYVWNLGHLSFSLVLKAQELGIAVAYYVCDNWLAYVDERDRWLRLRTRAQRLASPSRTARAHRADLRHVQFISHYLKGVALRARKPVADAKVIHWGIDAARFPYRERTGTAGGRLLYVGQVVPHKGVDTAIDALELLARRGGGERATLTVVGGTSKEAYAAKLRASVDARGLGARVRFLGHVGDERLTSVYGEHDVLVFPSRVDEGFPLTLLEAMASGLSVASTANGGSAEIVEHGVNALVFPAGDAEACADRVATLMADGALSDRLRANARRTVAEKFRLEDTLDRIEQALLEVSRDVRPPSL